MRIRAPISRPIVPMEVFLSIVALPSRDREWLIRRTEIMTRGGSIEAKQRALQEIFGYLESWLKERPERPGDDLISRILQLKVAIDRLTHQEALSECALVLFGGLDTVAGTMAFFARYLATHPEHRRSWRRTRSGFRGASRSCCGALRSRRSAGF